MEEIKDRIKKGMESRQMTAAELSRKSNIGRGSISKYLNGSVIPKQGAIKAIAKALGVSPIWLLGFDDEEEEPSQFDATTADFILEIKKLSPDGQFKAKNYIKYLLFEEGADSGHTRLE